MNSICITTDSHSGISRADAQNLGIRVLPMPFDIKNTTYYEDKDITREEFYDILRKGADVSTTQPSPAAVEEFWDSALTQYDQILYIPISSGLSGSYDTALAMSGEEKYKGRVFVCDCGRVSTTMHRSVLDGYELIKRGFTALQTQNILEKYRGEMIMYVSLSTLEYLKKGGRVKPAVAAVANILSIKPVMKFDVGILDVHKKVRGYKKAKKEMLDAISSELDGRFSEYYKQGRVKLLAASSSNRKETDEWVSQISEYFGCEVMCDDLSLGVSCHIGPDALGIGLSVVPEELM